ncbi:glycoside hydrolase family 20 zincin-like fold domain-containing protein [Streptomyces sp. NPDC052309]|uniref:glycoside hydrolase family 20 zincin-like fold domain-containing protein n=1 Tax=Streptomyces sp. NPDC052309 TaxID=3155421 RepID=UPI00342855A0
MLAALSTGLSPVAGSAAPGTPTDETAPSSPTTLPALSDWEPAAGSFTPARTGRVLVRDDELVDDAATFASDLSDVLGRTLPVKSTTMAPRAGDIVLDLESDRADLGSEGYALSVDNAIQVTGRTEDGASSAPGPCCSCFAPEPRCPPARPSTFPRTPSGASGCAPATSMCRCPGSNA